MATAQAWAERMNGSKPETPEARLQAYWQAALAGMIEDAKAEGADANLLAMIIDTMRDVALAECAKRDGAAVTARQLYLVALGFHAEANRQPGNAESSRAVH